MSQNKVVVWGVVAVLLLGAGVFLSMRRADLQADLGGSTVFPDLQAALGEVSEIRFSKGDGSRTTLRKDGAGWTVVERQFPADPVKVRELALALANLRVVERKTAQKESYPKLGVEATDSPSATGTLVEVVAGQKTWSLIVGKGAEGRAVYVRKPAEAGSLLAQPLVTADPDQKRWIDRLIVDLPGSKIHEVAVKPASGPAYLLSRAAPGAAELTLTPVARGRSPASNMVLSGPAESLSAFHFDDVRAATAPPAGAVDTATYRTFDGQVIEFTGHREGDKRFLRVKAQRDAALAARFPPTAPAAAIATPAAADAGGQETAKAAPAPSPAPASTPAPRDETTERLTARAAAVEFEVPAYKYDAIFKPYEELLEPKAK
jgi:hypothetical protein